MVTTKTIFFDNKKWEYIVKYRQQKHLYLRFEGHKLIISAPFFVKSEVIENFILDNLPKINQKISNQKNISNKINLLQDPYIYFLDQKLDIIVKYQTKTKIYLDNNALMIYSTYNLNNDENRKYLNDKINAFLKKIAQPIFNERLRYWEKVTNLQVKEFNLRLMKAKWGVCFHQTQTITLNYKLIHFSIEIIDYVIIHELCHLMYPNHSSDFWKLIALYCPGYKVCRQTLKYSNVGVKYEKD